MHGFPDISPEAIDRRYGLDKKEEKVVDVETSSSEESKEISEEDKEAMKMEIKMGLMKDQEHRINFNHERNSNK